MAPPNSQVLPPLHHEDLMATADDQMGQKSEPTRDPVNVTRRKNPHHMCSEGNRKRAKKKIPFKESADPGHQHPQSQSEIFVFDPFFYPFFFCRGKLG